MRMMGAAAAGRGSARTATRCSFRRPPRVPPPPAHSGRRSRRRRFGRRRRRPGEGAVRPRRRTRDSCYGAECVACCGAVEFLRRCGAVDSCCGAAALWSPTLAPSRFPRRRICGAESVDEALAGPSLPASRSPSSPSLFLSFPPSRSRCSRTVPLSLLSHNPPPLPLLCLCLCLCLCLSPTPTPSPFLYLPSPFPLPLPPPLPLPLPLPLHLPLPLLLPFPLPLPLHLPLPVPLPSLPLSLSLLSLLSLALLSLSPSSPRTLPTPRTAAVIEMSSGMRFGCSQDTAMLLAYRRTLQCCSRIAGHCNDARVSPDTAMLLACRRTLQLCSRIAGHCNAARVSQDTAMMLVYRRTLQ